MSVRVFAPAKINLTLGVGRIRADGLHPLQSVVAFADVGDVVDAAAADTLTLAIDGEFADALTADESNLVLRAARALADAVGLAAAPGATLSLEKNLPVASGVGGGSSDAAAALRALNELWRLGLDEPRLAAIARTLGADVPVCLHAGSAYMTGAGDVFEPIRAPALDAVLVNPLVALGTGDVYRTFDALGLGAELSPAPAPAWPDRAAALEAMAAAGNDLLPAARELVPEIERIFVLLRQDERVSYAALSGSGATVFAICANRDAAAALADDLQREQPGWWISDATLGGA